MSLGTGAAVVALDATGALNGKVLPLVGLAALVLLSLVALRSAHFRNAVGPGVLFAASALGASFFLGLTSGDLRVIENEIRVATLFAVGVAAVLLGAFARVALRPVPSLRRVQPFSALDNATVRGVALGMLGLAAVNMATGTVPLLAGNVDEARFSGQGGVISPVFVYVIGGLQWVLLVSLVTWLLKRERPKGSAWWILVAALALLFMLAARSFFVSVGLAAIVAAVMLGRLRLRTVFAIGVIGLVALAVAGQARVAGSDPTGESRQVLEQRGYGGIRGTIVLSSTTGPWVFGQTLDRVPGAVPFQRGQFALRDLKAQTPLQPFGDVQRSDLWVTQEVLRRDNDYGMPPTLVGGLYIDFGVPGIVLGCLLVGYVLAALFGWAAQRATVGAIALYGYASGYVALAAYSYLSIKPLTLTVLLLCFGVHVVERRRTAARRSLPSIGTA